MFLSGWRVYLAVYTTHWSTLRTPGVLASSSDSSSSNTRWREQRQRGKLPGRPRRFSLLGNGNFCTRQPGGSASGQVCCSRWPGPEVEGGSRPRGGPAKQSSALGDGRKENKLFTFTENPPSSSLSASRTSFSISFSFFSLCFSLRCSSDLQERINVKLRGKQRRSLLLF